MQCTCIYIQLPSESFYFIACFVLAHISWRLQGLYWMSVSQSSWKSLYKVRLQSDSSETCSRWKKPSILIKVSPLRAVCACPQTLFYIWILNRIIPFSFSETYKKKWQKLCYNQNFVPSGYELYEANGRKYTAQNRLELIWTTSWFLFLMVTVLLSVTHNWK